MQDHGNFLISYLSLIFLSYHRLRQLTIPFEEKADLNRFRIILIISIWIISLSIGFLRNYPRFYIITSDYHNRLFRLITNLFILYIPVFIIIVLNFLIVKQFIIKFKKKNLNKRNFRKEKKAIYCTISINSVLLLSQGLWFLFYPFEIFNFEFTFALQNIYLPIANSFAVFNPLVVFLFNKKLRKIFFFLNTVFQSNYFK